MFEGLFQPMHLLVVFGIALLVFGPKKLPELGKGIGEGIRGFKWAMKAEEEKPVGTTTTIANDQALFKEWIMGFGTEILFMLMLGLLVLGPKRLHTMLGHMARAKAELENATLGLKSQLTAQLGAEPERSPTDSSHESVLSEWATLRSSASQTRPAGQAHPTFIRRAVRTPEASVGEKTWIRPNITRRNILIIRWVRDCGHGVRPVKP
jgi:sec-independent protein translocase protein TatA